MVVCIEEVKNCVNDCGLPPLVRVLDVPRDCAVLHCAHVALLNGVSGAKYRWKRQTLTFVHVKSQSFVLAHVKFLIFLVHVAQHGFVDLYDPLLFGSGQHGKRRECEETGEFVLVHF